MLPAGVVKQQDMNTAVDAVQGEMGVTANIDQPEGMSDAELKG